MWVFGYPTKIDAFFIRTILQEQRPKFTGSYKKKACRRSYGLVAHNVGHMLGGINEVFGHSPLLTIKMET